MDCKVRFPNGKTSSMKNIDSSWSVADLVHQLQLRNLLTEVEVNALQSIGLDLQQPIPPVLDFTPRAESQSESATSLSASSQPQEQPQTSTGGLAKKTSTTASKPNPASGGLKNKSVQHSSSGGGLKKKRQNSTPLPTPVPQPKPQPINPIVIKPPISVAGRKTYTIDMLCSKSKAKWHASLLGETEPSKSQTPTSARNSQTSGYGTIHIILDDSGSMAINQASRQLKAATLQFLNDRPKSDVIHLTVLSNRWSQRGSPSDMTRYVGSVGTDWGTPMKTRFEALANEVGGKKSENPDVVVFFTDGDSTDGSPVPAANHLKKYLGARIICIGCGSSVQQSVLKKMASSSSDYHHANNASDILQAFQAVAQSLGQLTPTVTSGGKNSTGSTAKQISSDSGSAPTNTSSNYGNTSKLDGDYGFEVIKDFSCHHCKNDIRTFCPSCNVAQCAGSCHKIPDPQDASKQILAMNCGSCVT